MVSQVCEWGEVYVLNRKHKEKKKRHLYCLQMQYTREHPTVDSAGFTEFCVKRLGPSGICRLLFCNLRREWSAAVTDCRLNYAYWLKIWGWLKTSREYFLAYCFINLRSSFYLFFRIFNGVLQRQALMLKYFSWFSFFFCLYHNLVWPNSGAGQRVSIPAESMIQGPRTLLDLKFHKMVFI